MARTFTNEYKLSDIEELAMTVKAAWNWSSIDHEEDSTEWSFYINAEKTKGINIKQYVNGTTQGIQVSIIFNGEAYFTNSPATWLCVRCTATSSVFVFEYKVVSAASASPCPPESYKYIVCTGVNQVTNEEEPIIAYYDAATSISNGYKTCVFSNDNSILTANTATDRLSDNRSSKVTVITPMFDKNSECIAKDVYTVSATQLAAISYGDATLGGRKYCMCGSVWIADE